MRVRAALETLEHGLDALLTSDAFAAYLRVMARLPHYSVGNLVLIHVQQPTASLVAGYRRWQALGRQVKRGEQGIRILVPHTFRTTDPETDEEQVIVRRFGVGTVFDVAQTEGAPLPEPPPVRRLDGASDVGMRLFVDLWDYLGTAGMSVARETTAPANGYFRPAARHVGIGEHLDGDQATKTLAHETAHVVAGHTPGMPEREVETVAEAAAFVILARYGLDSREYSFPYIARWAQDRRVLQRNLDAVRRVSATVIADLDVGAGSNGTRTPWTEDLT